MRIIHIQLDRLFIEATPLASSSWTPERDDEFRATGHFVPKPGTDEGCQRRSASDLGQSVRECPLASTAAGGDCYSLGSVAREPVP